MILWKNAIATIADSQSKLQEAMKNFSIEESRSYVSKGDLQHKLKKEGTWHLFANQKVKQSYLLFFINHNFNTK